MRGSSIGALSRRFLHSAITEHLWCSVIEVESMFAANLSHAIMLASMYGNPQASLEKGNDQIHTMYLKALNTLPYMKATKHTAKAEADALIEEWKRINAAAQPGEGGGDA